MSNISYTPPPKNKSLPIVRVSPDEEAIIRRAAQISGEHYAAFARRVLLAASKMILEK